MKRLPRLRLIVMFVASCSVVPPIVYFAVAADARAAGEDALTGETIAAGIVVAILFLLTGLVVFVQPAAAGQMFMLGGILAVLGGHDDGREGIAVYGPCAVLMTALSLACSWRRLPTWLRD